MNRDFICFCMVFLVICISFTTFSDEYYIPDLFVGFENEGEMEQAENDGLESGKIQYRTGVYYFMKANHSSNSRQKKKFLENSIQIFEDIWSKDRRNNRAALLLAYSYLAICDTDISFDQIIENVSRAENLINLVISRVPQNIDARLIRTHININLAPQMGRPDDVILKDVKVYTEAYKSLSEEERNRDDLKLGYMVMQLAAAVVLDYRNDKDAALGHFKKIDHAYLQAENLINLYKRLEEKYGGKQ